jgi:hypothetical protein
MKKNFALFLFATALYTASFAQVDDKKTISISTDDQPKAVFEKTTHDFGTIKEGTQATVDFVVKNTGTAPLIISSVTASCGCTTPDWTRDPIAPGASGKVTAVYNSTGRLGNFTKTVTVKYNGESGTEYLTIKGIVEAVPAPPAPAVKNPNQ